MCSKIYICVPRVAQAHVARYLRLNRKSKMVFCCTRWHRTSNLQATHNLIFQLILVDSLQVNVKLYF